jgi:hypothetical protein
MDRLDDPGHLVSGPGRGLRIGPVEVELHQVGTVIKLPERGGNQLITVVRLDGQPGGQQPRCRDPGARSPHVRPVPAAPPPVSNGDAQGPLATGIGAPRRPDIAGPPHAAAVLELAVGLRHSKQGLGRVTGPVDPMRTAGKRQMAVSVDQARHDGRTTGVDDLAVDRLLALVLGRTDPGDPTVFDQHADAQPQIRRPPVGHRCITIDGGSHKGSPYPGPRSRQRRNPPGDPAGDRSRPPARPVRRSDFCGN